jgi:hypothetical protein
MSNPDEEVDYDFDEAWAERKVTQPTIRLKGNVYHLPAVIPAKFILFVAKATKGKKATDDVTPQEAIVLFEMILGKDNTKEILESGIGLDELPEVLEQIQRIYMKRAEKNIQASRDKEGN